MRERRRRLVAALSASLFGGTVTGIVGELWYMLLPEPVAPIEYVAVWALAIFVGSIAGAPVLKVTLDRFDYRISYHAAVVALVAGQAWVAVEVWFHLSAILPYGVMSLVASAAIVWVVARFASARSAPEPL